MNKTLFNVILLCALVLWSMAPSASFMFKAQSGADWIEICTAQGYAKVQLPADALPTGQSDHQERPSCPFCGIADNGSKYSLFVQPTQNFAHNVHLIKKTQQKYHYIISKSYKSGLSTPAQAPPHFS